jgi:hypothetical protein
MHTPVPLEQRVASLEDGLAALGQQLALLISRSERPLEQRLALVEEEITNLKRRIECLTPGESKNWLKDVIGSMKDFPEFEEVARLGAEIRRADRLNDEDE